jgi:hypothetical protein
MQCALQCMRLSRRNSLQSSAQMQLLCEGLVSPSTEHRLVRQGACSPGMLPYHYPPIILCTIHPLCICLFVHGHIVLSLGSTHALGSNTRNLLLPPCWPGGWCSVLLAVHALLTVLNPCEQFDGWQCPCSRSVRLTGTGWLN